MSELNNDINVERSLKKKHSIRNSIIFLLFFAIVCVGVTAFLIYQQQNVVKDKESEQAKNEVIEEQNNVIDNTVKEDSKPEKLDVKKEVTECEGLQSITETYRENNINIIEKEFKEGSKISELDNKINITYIEIDGLKDAKLQKEINKRIIDTAMSMYAEEEIADERIDRIDIYTQTYANYENVLSININKDIYYKNTEIDDKLENKAININLINGEDIAFEEVFVKGAPIKNILSQAAYEALIGEIPFADDEVFVSDMSKKDYSDVDDEVFAIMQYYNTHSDIKYSFTENYIHVYIRGHLIAIKMLDYYEYIAIYNRYKTNANIYDGRFENNQEIMVFKHFDGMEYLKYYNVGKASDNLIVNIRIGKEETYSEIYSSTINEYEKQIKQKIEEYKNLNDGKARYINMDIQTISMEWDEEVEHSINIKYDEYETSQEYYDKKFERDIVESLCYGFCDGSINYNEVEIKQNVKKVQDEYVELTYNFEKGQFEKSN